MESAFLNSAAQCKNPLSILSDMVRLHLCKYLPILETRYDLELRHCLLARRPRSWLISVDQIDTAIQDPKQCCLDIIVDEPTCGVNRLTILGTGMYTEPARFGSSLLPRSCHRRRSEIKPHLISHPCA